MALKFISFQDFSNRSKACEPLWNPQQLVEAKTFNSALTCFPVNGGDKVIGDPTAFAPVSEDCCGLCVVIQLMSVPLGKLAFIHPKTPSKGVEGVDSLGS